ncbi:MAG: acetyl-CoA carboxylase carboxyl transferase subunit beta [Chloroflexi bacterium]|nr:acetyl-CoA carboxylase carboxyl transferase subunit beta [Chloroflexota bacterium]
MGAQSAGPAGAGDESTRRSTGSSETAVAPRCPRCGADLGPSTTYARFHVCPACRLHLPISARVRLSLLLDDGSFREMYRTLTSVDPLLFTDRVPYSERLGDAREKTGLEEAVVVGTGRINARECVIAMLAFEFMGGSMGTVVGEKVALAMEHAVDHGLPFISLAASGGARMQEGMLSLVQMAKTDAAAMRLHRAGLPFISVLTNPTTGGVYASFASQGDVILAEPGALIGFAGPRVIEQITGRTMPKDAQTAEYLFEHGQIDGIVDRTRLRNVLATLLQLFENPWGLTARGDPDLYRPDVRPPPSAWQAVELARHPDRPTTRDYIRSMLPQFVELHGDRLNADDPAVICGIGDLGGITIMLIGQERGRTAEERDFRRGGRMGAEGYRKADRAMRLAGAWGLPVVTLIDTPGAALDFDSEARGLAPSISRCLGTMSILPVPVVAAVIGEGGSGGALALGVADRILMQENAIYSVIAPEGAAAILYHDAQRARDLADALKLTAADCKLLGVVDTVVPEPEGGAHADSAYAALVLKNFIVDALLGMRRTRAKRLLDSRYRKFRRMGQPPTTSRRESFSLEMDELQKRFGSALTQMLEYLPLREGSTHADANGAVENGTEERDAETNGTADDHPES